MGCALSGTGLAEWRCGGAMKRKTLLMALPGAGKATRSRVLAQRLNAVHLDADQWREHINRSLGSAPADRVEHARRMGGAKDRAGEGNRQQTAVAQGTKLTVRTSIAWS